MSKRKKAVLILGIIPQLFWVVYIIVAVISIFHGNEIDIYIKSLNFDEKIDALFSTDTGTLIGYGSMMILPWVFSAVHLGYFLTYMILNDYLPKAYMVAVNVFKCVWWTWFLPPLGLVVTIFIFITPFFLGYLIFLFIPIAPALVYVLFMDKAPKEQYTYSE